MRSLISHPVQMKSAKTPGKAEWLRELNRMVSPHLTEQ